MKKTDRANTMTANEYANHRGVVKSTVSKWKQKNLLVMKSGRIDVAASDAILDRIEQRFTDGQEPKNISEAQFMKETFLAKLRRQEYLQKSGELIERDIVRSTLTDIFNQHRDGLLIIPDRTAPSLALETDAARIRNLLLTEITGHLNALANKLKGK